MSFNKAVLITFFAWLLSFQTNAQFIVAGQVDSADHYTDIVPDAQLRAYYNHSFYSNADTLFIDLDQDGQPDLFVYSIEGNGIGSGGTDVYIHVLNAQCQIASQADTLKETGADSTGRIYIHSAVPFSVNDTINASGTWNTNDNYLFENSYSLGSYYGFSWPQSADYYAGVKFLKNGNTSYGWIRIELADQQDTLVTTVKDYAINRAVISAVIIDSNKVFNIFPNPAQDNIVITLPNATLDNPVILFFDCAGRLVSELTAIQTNSGYQVSLPDLPNGLYFMKILYGNRTEYSKLSIHH